MNKQQTFSSSIVFDDDYELFIDHGDGKRTKLNENEETFRDLQRFLLQQDSLFESTKQQKKIDDPEKTQDKHLLTKVMDLSAKSLATASKNIFYHQTWLSNKNDNQRVMSSVMDSKSKNKTSKCRFGLRIAANGLSKSHRSSTIPSTNTSLIKGNFGDDAGIVMKTEETCFVALADGASGNRALGLNPADFSNEILSACHNVIQEKNLKSDELPELVLAALDKIRKSRVQGSGTLCLLGLNREEKTLTTLNIGDSGYVIYRKNQIYHRSQCTNDPESNAPRQLFVFDHSIGLPSLNTRKDILHQSSLEQIRLEKNDLIILSSDGLWDVIESDQLDLIVQTHQDLPNLAEHLLRFAIRGYSHHGRDDILIIVCRVDEY